MFAIDTSLLVYAHNQDSEFNSKAKAFLEKVMNDRDEYGDLSVCLPSQVLTEFISVITKQGLENPLSLSKAISVVHDYLDSGIVIINQTQNHFDTFLDLLNSVTSRKKYLMLFWRQLSRIIIYQAFIQSMLTILIILGF